MFGFPKKEKNKVIEQFEAATIYTLDDIVDSDIYVRITRIQLEDIFNRLNKLEQPISINHVPTLSGKIANKSRKKK